MMNLKTHTQIEILIIVNSKSKNDKLRVQKHSTVELEFLVLLCSVTGVEHSST